MTAQQGQQEDRTEDPTPKRRREAREEGRVPKTQELSAAVVLLAGGLLLTPGARALAASFERIATVGLGSGPSALSGLPSAVDWLRWVTVQSALAFFPFGVGLGVLALAVGAVQGRGTLTLKPLKPSWNRLSPGERLRRFLGTQPWVDLLKAVLKVVIVGAVVWMALGGAVADLTRLSQTNPRDVVEVLRAEAVRVLLSAGLALLGLSLLDYVYQTRQQERQLRMTRDEVRRETKDAEGDPLVRARLRSLGRSLARLRMMSEVPAADVVVTNPTHIAVALRYDPEKADAPIVVAMGQRKLAERIKRIAQESGVPVVENRPVARALLGLGRVGEPIPHALYVAVAEILAFVFRHRRPTRPRMETTA